MEAEILFHTEAGGEPLADGDSAQLAEWMALVIDRRGGAAGAMNVVLCGDDYLHAMNLRYLDHDTLTDIITFPYGDFPTVSGDLFVSTHRVADNARELGVPYRDELHRVIIHGVLHLCGLGDKNPEHAAAMRRAEDEALLLRPRPLRSPS